MNPFKNHEVRVRLAKQGNDDPTPAEKQINPESVKLVEDTAKRFVKNLAITVGVVILACKAADTLSQIVVKKTKSADNE
jgi:hypothetical protein